MRNDDRDTNAAKRIALDPEAMLASVELPEPCAGIRQSDAVMRLVAIFSRKCGRRGLKICRQQQTSLGCIRPLLRVFRSLG